MVSSSLVELDPVEVAQQLAAGEIRLIDVREPHEFRSARIEGAESYPLSAFDPSALPDDKPIVFHCAVGGRSAQAVAVSLAHGLPHSRHLRGGLSAWLANGLPVVR